MRYNKSIRKRFYHYFSKKLGSYVYGNKGWLKSDCPECGEHKFGINLYQNRTHCFKCNINPKPIKLLMELERLTTFPEAWDYLKTFEEVDFYEVPLEMIKEPDLSLPESFRLLTFGKSRVARIARNYIRKRGFDVEELTLKGVGYCTKGDYAHHIIMPYYHKGKIVYFNARRFMFEGPKYNNPSEEEIGIGRSLVMYNSDALFIYKKVYLLEGMFNAYTMGDQAISTGGKHLSQYQLSLILKSPVEHIIILLDPDAYVEAIKYALQFTKLGKKVKLVKLPEGKDVNDLGKKKTLKIVRRHKFIDYNECLKINMYEKDSQYTY